MSFIYSPAVKNQEFRCLIFSPELQILLPFESEQCIDLPLFKMFLDCAKKGVKGKIQLTPHFMVDLDLMIFCVRGYLLQETPSQYICSSLGTTHTIKYEIKNDKVITTLEYLYHMMTCI